ncbi:hypothetical protein Lal_00003872 [Lupinus albus]|uniref:Uncharacterized protein n=1 Tax=Lupinus albus TaxID=3870 RepID=A0A6A5P8Q6_LUPAL|nr:hypothetical protein Lalb_Chr15g0078571 [Lupinus albus]KAF1893957.1 hypothetical protein Lal_00003872 [Lupinus albus]
MASNAIKQRDPTTTTTTMNNKRRSGGGSRRDKRMVMAKHGFRSLAIAVSLPLSLTLISMYLGLSLHTQQHAHHDDASRKPFWFPPSWVLHLLCPASSFLMGISAWMVWANGGFHRNPVALMLYLTQIMFTVLWDPLVFGFGTIRVGFIVCLGMFVALFGCMHVFGKVNSVAADLVKPCLAWIAFLSIVNLKLVYL